MSAELLTVTSADGSASAAFAPAANMVCCSLVVAGRERLSLRSGLEAYAERGATMGIPLLLPWANRLAGRSFRVAGREVELPADARVHADADGTPLHGLTPSLMRWSEARAEGGRVQAQLAWSSPELLGLFPFAHELSHLAELDARSLTVTIAVRATGEDEVPVSFGLHPYLRLEGPREEWSVELPPCRQLELDERMLPTGALRAAPAGPVGLGERGFDDAFGLEAAEATFVARRGQAELRVELLEGFPYAQVFSPPGADFVCFEPMTAPANALISGDGLRVLGPGQALRTRFRVVVVEP